MSEKSTEVLSGENREDVRLMPHLSTTTSTALAPIAGFKLDALVDERVFGHTIAWRNSFAWRTDIIDEIKANSRGFDLVSASRAAGAWVPAYSSLIQEAWKLVGELAVRGWSLGLTHIKTAQGWQYRCDLHHEESGDVADGFAVEAPLAICLAALEAVSA